MRTIIIFEYFLLVVIFSIIYSIPVKGESNTFLATEDAFIDEGGPTGKFGDLDFLYIDEGDTDAYSLIKFDISNYVGSTVNSAFLKITTIAPRIGTNMYGEIHIHQITTDWSQSTVTWDTKPGINQLEESTFYGNISQTEEEIIYTLVDITDLAKNWFSGESNHGLALITDNEVPEYNWASSENTEHAGPSLIVNGTLISNTNESDSNPSVLPFTPFLLGTTLFVSVRFARRTRC